MKRFLGIFFIYIGLFSVGCKKKVPERSTADIAAAEHAQLTTERDRLAAERARQIVDMLDNLTSSLFAAANGQAEVIRTAEGIGITFQLDFYFESSSAILTEAAAEILTNISTVLNEHPFTEILIEGHADSSGNQDFNKILSQHRAKNVAIFLRDRDVNASRFAVAGYGATRPVASNVTPEGRMQNRRVVIKISVREEEFLETLTQ